jgi:hypothetical protein
MSCRAFKTNAFGFMFPWTRECAACFITMTSFIIHHLKKYRTLKMIPLPCISPTTRESAACAASIHG